jgi:hypothetical protein
MSLGPRRVGLQNGVAPAKRRVKHRRDDDEAAGQAAYHRFHANFVAACGRDRQRCAGVGR